MTLKEVLLVFGRHVGLLINSLQKDGNPRGHMRGGRCGHQGRAQHLGGGERHQHQGEDSAFGGQGGVGTRKGSAFGGQGPEGGSFFIKDGAAKGRVHAK